MGVSRRVELAAFLRSRRARLTPADVGLPAGLRRRTPGLRREELAQLAGVGVTWYTWLEQGRPINASVQVLEAIARTLRLDHAEREHLYRLADVPSFPPPCATVQLDPAVQHVLDGFEKIPAAIYSSRYDVLAFNATYAALFPGLRSDRNVLWHLFASRECCAPFVNRDEELPMMVAMLRSAFGRHLGESAWETFVRDLCQVSDEFSRLWEAHNVAAPGPRTKVFRHWLAGEVRLTTSSFAVSGTPEARMLVYTPMDEDSRERLTRVRPHPVGYAGCTHAAA
jgi:transcriptional regulator with XRE-family HTH domain